MPKQWKTALLVCIALGIFFRLFNISNKVYWHDETINSARVAGYGLNEIYNELPKNVPFGVNVLEKYQYPSSANSSFDVIQVLATQEPQNPPLYYVLSRLWLSWTSHSIAAARSLSAVISVVAVGAMYLLARELFGAPPFGLVAAAIMAISPFHVLYAQEARPFSLWTLTILLSSVCLLRALRLQTWRQWLGYTVATTAGLYTFPFTFFVLTGHGLYILVNNSLRTVARLVWFSIAAAVSLLLFSPWLGAIYQNIHRMSSWRYADTTVSSLVKTWVGNLCRLFFDVNLDATSPLAYVLLPALAVLALIAYSLCSLLWQSPRKISSFVVFLILVTAAALILPDLISSGRRSSISRYFIPTYLGLQLAVAYVFTHKLSATSRLWGGILALLLGAGVLSNSVSAHASVWWTKPLSLDNFAIVQAISSFPNPVLVSDRPMWQTLELSHYLPETTQLLIPTENKELGQVKILAGSKFLLYPSTQLMDVFKESDDYQMKPLDNLKNQNIFHLERQ